MSSFDLKKEKIYLAAWLKLPRLGPSALTKLRDHFGSYQLAWQARQVSDEKMQAFLDRTKSFRQQLDPESYWRHLSQESLLTWLDQDYPRRLLNSYPEPLLFYRGNLQLLNHLRYLAIVGSRRLDNYNAASLRQVFQELEGSSLVIISGLAYGIDALAHKLALKAGLPTIAVLGASVTQNEIYPAEHQSLAQQILSANGLLLSPFPAGTLIDRGNFPRRNQTMAGLAEAVLVVSAAQKSGALITAGLAADAGREVLAIPGNIDQALSQGSNRLLQQGATMVTSGQDVLDALRLPRPDRSTREQPIDLEPEQQRLVEQLRLGPQNVDQLLQDLKIGRQQLLAQLTGLELKGLIEKLPGNLIRLK